MKRISKLTGILAALTLAFGLVACANATDETKNGPSKQQKNKEAVESIEGAYYFDYEGDYKLEDCINANLTTSEKLLDYLEDFIPELLGLGERSISLSLNFNGFGCSSITASNAGSAGGKIYGRNFDYWNSAAMVVHTKPAKGYESVSTCYPAFVTNDIDWVPENELKKTIVGISSIFAPLDGMNEKGLYISILQLDSEPTNQTAEGKHDVQTTVAVRYILDNAASVDEALALLDGVNMHNVFNTAYHYAIADTTGKSVVVEYIGNKKYVTDAKVVTNFYLTPDSGKKAPKETDSSYLRFKAAEDAGETANWNMTPAKVRDALKAASASQHNSDPNDIHKTIWSAIYEPNAKKVTYYFRENYDKGVEVTF